MERKRPRLLTLLSPPGACASSVSATETIALQSACHLRVHMAVPSVRFACSQVVFSKSFRFRWGLCKQSAVFQRWYPLRLWEILCVSVVNLPEQKFTTEARSHRDTESDLEFTQRCIGQRLSCTALEYQLQLGFPAVKENARLKSVL